MGPRCYNGARTRARGSGSPPGALRCGVRTVAIDLEQLSQALGIAPDTLQREALKAWVLGELARLDGEIAQMVVKYGARSPDEVEEKIRSGTLKGHPAWEDAIRWEGLEEHRSKLLGALALGREGPA